MRLGDKPSATAVMMGGQRRLYRTTGRNVLLQKGPNKAEML